MVEFQSKLVTKFALGVGSTDGTDIDLKDESLHSRLWQDYCMCVCVWGGRFLHTCALSTLEGPYKDIKYVWFIHLEMDKRQSQRALRRLRSFQWSGELRVFREDSLL